MGLVIKKDNFEKIKKIADRRAPIYHVGEVKENKKLILRVKVKLIQST